MNNDFVSNTPNPRYQAAFRRPTPPRPQASPEPPEVPSVPENFPSARKKPSPIPVIICLILAIAGITFGVIEFLKNSELKTEIEDLKTKISGLEAKPEEKPEKPEKPEEKPYSGTAELKYRIDYPEKDPTIVDSPTGKAYSINLDYDTGKLRVEIETLGVVCPDDCIEKKEVTLTQQELGKIYYITSYGSYKDIEIESGFTTSNYIAGETLESILTKLVYDGQELATKENADAEDWEEVSDYDINDDGILTYREYSNKILDDILFEIYGQINCASPDPGIIENSETNCGEDKDNCIETETETDCLNGPEGTDCGDARVEKNWPYLDCKTAKEIDYPYIAY